MANRINGPDKLDVEGIMATTKKNLLLVERVLVHVRLYMERERRGGILSKI